jgi:NAD(P)-dependent dehydrogenase (short-subunit alcohol dehydrogenase family)
MLTSPSTASYPSSKDRLFGTKVDLSSPQTLEQELQTLLDTATRDMGGEPLDHIVFTAGDALATRPIAEISMDSIIAAGRIRFFAPLLLAKFIPKYLRQSHTSSYTVTTGSIGERPMPNWSVIASYAGGHHSMVRNLALDLKPVRVNGVAPGVVDTELWRMPKEEKDKVMKSTGDKLATGRAGHAEDVAESFLGILKDHNMTGSMVRSDGGGLFA